MAAISLPANREALFLSLYETDLPDGVIFRLAAQARPAILLATAESDEDAISLGASKIGGRPDLPRGSAWPTRPPYPDAGQRAEGHRKEADRLLADSRKPRSWMTPEQGDRFSREYKARADSIEAEFPLAFFAQVDLFELSKEEGFDPAFPSEGRLLVFYDFWEQPEDFTPEASVGWQVIWDKTPHAELVRVPFPAALSSISCDEWTCIFRAARISARTVLTPIPPNDKSWDAFPLDDDEALEAYQEWLEQFGTPDAIDRDNHQLGGFPQTLQNGLQACSQLAANGVNCGRGEAWETDAAKELLKSAGDWQLVLQIGVDRHAGIPQPGAYYVIMRKEDIAARRFDRARVTYQCD
ncbi:DUF1963 domain-containing protein [Rhizobium sp. M1]|uniref:YwqG family protein n=1 Tax=Rhizobium sp. M1 TaxID=2035453 RepID=UPI000BE8193A|nr:DUF1963 domain-containing protein [Rhizobium sp. M1]PDT11309.1 hypothetical protein CO655_09705 [Rhizobium sp. M1]